MLGENAFDSALLGVESLMHGVRADSRGIIDNADSAGMAAAGATLYAVNSLTDAVVSGGVGFARLATSSQQRHQFAQGVGALVSDPVGTVRNGWTAWGSVVSHMRSSTLLAAARQGKLRLRP